MRKEIEKECIFLQDWGQLFKQCHADAPAYGFDKNYQTCVDAFQSLKGKALLFHKNEASLIAGLNNIKVRLSERNKTGLFKSYQAYAATVAMIDSIIDMLTVTDHQAAVQGCLF